MRCCECGKRMRSTTANICEDCLAEELRKLEPEKTMLTVKEMQRELSREKFDVKNTPVMVRLPNGETYRASTISIYDDMAIIEAVNGVDEVVIDADRSEK